MPKSKRNKIVHLTKVKKKGKDHKEDMAKNLETYLAQYKRVYVFDFEATKSDRIMLFRNWMKEHGRVFAGKNKVSTSTFESYGKKTNTKYDNLIEQIKGHKGLLFTDMEPEEFVSKLADVFPAFSSKLVGHAEIAPKSRVINQSGDTRDGATSSPAKESVADGSHLDKEKKVKKNPKTVVQFVKA